MVRFAAKVASWGVVVPRGADDEVEASGVGGPEAEPSAPGGVPGRLWWAFSSGAVFFSRGLPMRRDRLYTHSSLWFAHR